MWGKLGKYEEIVSYNYLTTFLHLVTQILKSNIISKC